MKNERLKIILLFTCQKKEPEPTQIYRLRLQPKNLGSDRLRNTVANHRLAEANRKANISREADTGTASWWISLVQIVGSGSGSGLFLQDSDSTHFSIL